MPIEVPYQLIAKGFTEALGRNPSPTELVVNQQSLQVGGCRDAVVGPWMTMLLDGPEARSLPLTNRQRVQAAYRLLLNRDPDNAGWNYYESLPFPTAIAQIRKAPEYRANIFKICNNRA